MPKNTSERIVESSLELFNLQGERSVSTNHIAAHMGISPGNLYYHFPNKQAIVAVLFGEHEALIDSFLRPPQGRVMTLADKQGYFYGLSVAIWRYRFLYRDLEHLLENDPALAARYRSFCQRGLTHVQAIYAGFVEAGIMCMNKVQIESLALNAWMVMSSWVRFFCTARNNAPPLSQDSLKRGVYQVLMLESGFVTAQARPGFDALLEVFYVPFE